MTVKTVPAGFKETRGDLQNNGYVVKNERIVDDAALRAAFKTCLHDCLMDWQPSGQQVLDMLSDARAECAKDYPCIGAENPGL